MPANDVILEFGRRHKAVNQALVAALVAWGAVVASVPAVSMEVVPNWLPLPLGAIGLVLLVRYYVALSRYRCPVCDTRPAAEDGDPTTERPPVCVKCQSRLA